MDIGQFFKIKQIKIFLIGFDDEKGDLQPAAWQPAASQKIENIKRFNI